MVMTIGADDFLRSTLIRPEWYPCVISKYTEDEDQSGAALHVFEAKIEGGEYDQVPLRIQFSEKAMGFAKEFMEALRGKVFTKEEMKAGFTIDGEKAVGKRIKVHVSTGDYKGRKQNNPDGFRPIEQK